MEKDTFIKPVSYVAEVNFAEEMAYAEKPHRDFINSDEFNRLVEIGTEGFDSDTLNKYENVQERLKGKVNSLGGEKATRLLSNLEKDILSDTLVTAYDFSKPEEETVNTPELSSDDKKEKVSRLLAYNAVKSAETASTRVYKNMARDRYAKGINRKPLNGGLPTLGKGRR